MLLQGLAAAATQDDFEGGRTEAMLGPGAGNDTVNLTIPVNCHVLGATFQVSGLPDNDTGQHPGAVSVLVNGTPVWKFDGEGYGALGLQQCFLSGCGEIGFDIGAGGGAGSAVIRLPNEAGVRSASMAAHFSGRERTSELGNYSGPQWDEEMGYTVSGAGDLNGDGYDDFALGVHRNDTRGDCSGAVFVYFGGPEMNVTPDLVMYGESAWDFFGISVAGAGDVNGDGFDDLVVGACYNNSVAVWAGRAYIYFGGAGMDDRPDVVLNGTMSYEDFGTAVAGAGDVNGDGFDDVLVGAPFSCRVQVWAGAAYLFFGGKSMDSTPDLAIDGVAREDSFGYQLDGAGDVDADGYDDFIVAAPFADGNGNDSGRAYVFLGGPQPDGIPDVQMTGEAAGDKFGWPVSDAGDVNADGYGDVIVGAAANDAKGSGAGRAYVYLGGKPMDGDADVVLDGPCNNSFFGQSVSGAGDVNRDGYSDVIVGAPNEAEGPVGRGTARVFCGGPGMDNGWDVELWGTGENTSFGWSVSGAGDVNRDGYDDFLVGAPFNSSLVYRGGQAHLYSRARFLADTGISIGDRTVWNWPGNTTGRQMLANFSSELAACLSGSRPSGTDGFGNSYVEVLVNVSAGEEGSIYLDSVNITYDFGARVLDFSGLLNGLLAERRAGTDFGGSLTVPVQVTFGTPGRLRLYGLNLTLDGPPEQARPVGPVYIDEDTASDNLVDLWDYFRDDLDANTTLNISVLSANNGDYVRVLVVDNRYLSADAASGPKNDNWTGEAGVVLRVKDRWGSYADSEQFNLVVRNVNDPPFITSSPALEAVAGFEYSYQVSAVDGDGDRISYGLGSGPAGMTVDPSTGKLAWTPASGGLQNVSVAASDGQATTCQNFTLTVKVLNKVPIFISQPALDATVGLQYIYDAEAADVDQDVLVYGLRVFPNGMTLDNATGTLAWTPGDGDIGNHTILLAVRDGKGGESTQQYVLNVRPFVKPRVSVSRPLGGMTVSGRYIFAGSVERGTLDVVGVQLKIDTGEWMNATGNSSWGLAVDSEKLGNGGHLLQVRAYDAKGYSDTVTVNIRVDNAKPAGTDMVLVAVSAVIVIAVALVSFLVWRRRRPKVYDWG